MDKIPSGKWKYPIKNAYWLPGTNKITPSEKLLANQIQAGRETDTMVRELTKWNSIDQTGHRKADKLRLRM